jgi:ATP-dependent Lon protease
VPVLPVTRGVVLPGGTIGIRAGRAASIRAVRRAEAADRKIALLCLVDPQLEIADPGPDDLMEVGVLATLDRVSGTDDRIELVAACQVRIAVREWKDRADLTATVAVRRDPEPSDATIGRIEEVRQLVASILRRRMERREAPGMLALAASLHGGAMLDHIAREGPLTDDERRMVLEAVDLEARVSVVLAALSRVA